MCVGGWLNIISPPSPLDDSGPLPASLPLPSPPSLFFPTSVTPNVGESEMKQLGANRQAEHEEGC